MKPRETNTKLSEKHTVATPRTYAENDNNDDDCDANVENVVGMPIGDLFPSTLFEVSIGPTTLPVLMPVESALEAFEGSDDSEGADSDDDELDFPNLHLLSLTTPKRDSTTGTRTTADTDEDYRTLFETIDTIIFGVDLFGNINEWNHKMEEHTGISKDAAMGRSLLEDTSLPLLPFPDPSRRMPRSEMLTLRDQVEPILSDAYRGQSCLELNLKLKSTSTTVTSLGKPQTRAMLRHLTASVSPRYDTQQQVVGALFLGTDLTEGFSRFMGIRQDAHELRKLIDTTNAPIFGIDAHGYVSLFICLLVCTTAEKKHCLSNQNTVTHQPFASCCIMLC